MKTFAMALLCAIGLTFLMNGSAQAQSPADMLRQRQQDQVRLLETKQHAEADKLQHRLALEKLRIGNTPEEQEKFRLHESTEIGRLKVKHARQIEQLAGTHARQVIAMQYAAQRQQRMIENQLAYQRALYQQRLYLNQLYLQQVQNQIHWQNSYFYYGRPIVIGRRCY
jgi:hypothetical protein